MEVTRQISLADFDAWSGAKDTKERIIEEGKDRDFEYLMEELYPDGLTDSQLNDILWFEEDWVFEQLGISDLITCDECGETVDESEWEDEQDCCIHCAEY